MMARLPRTATVRIGLATLACLALTSSLTAGCAKKPTPSANPTVSTDLGATPSASAAASPSAAAPSPSSAPAGPTYPKTAKAYAQAVLNAWAGKNWSRVDQLAIQSAVQQIKDNGEANTQWTYARCGSPDPASSECVFRNAHGDVAEVTLNTAQLGHPTAVTAVFLERTEYPNVASDYVGTFLSAWRTGNIQRMNRLASSGVVAFFDGKPKPASWTIGNNGGGAGHLWVTVNPDTGGQWDFQLIGERMGKAEAIDGVH